MLSKNMVKFCSGDFNPDSVPVETKHLDPLLSTASKSPPDQIPAKGLDGKFLSELIFLWCKYKCDLELEDSFFWDTVMT